MNENQKKGLYYILAGILAYFFVGYLISILLIPLKFLIGSYAVELYSTVPYIKVIVAFILVAKGISTAIFENKNNTIKANMIPDSNDTTANKVVNVTLTGGLIGLFLDSPQNSLNRKIRKENANGWEVVQIIPSQSGNILEFILRILLLLVTFFLFTTANGYYIIMKRASK